MHARVWQLHVRPGKVQDFQDILSSLVELARQQHGYRGVLALASGKRRQSIRHAGNRTLSGLLRRLPTHHGTGVARKRFHRNQCTCQGVSCIF
jgi:hypothetical protein